MKLRNVLAISISLTVVALVLAQPTGQAQAPTTGSAAPIFMPAADVKWADLDPTGAPGVKIAPLCGATLARDRSARSSSFRRDSPLPLHTHTHVMKVVFLSGTYVQAPEGKPEVRLGPGGYMMQPGGNYRHTTSCDKASDCVLFVESEGAFDLKMVETAKPPAKP